MKFIAVIGTRNAVAVGTVIGTVVEAVVGTETVTGSDVAVGVGRGREVEAGSGVIAHALGKEIAGGGASQKAQSGVWDNKFLRVQQYYIA